MEFISITASHKSIGDGENNSYILSTIEEPWKIGVWCDTYTGEKDVEINWWCLEWQQPRLINILQFRQGPISESGGWWRSFWIEYKLYDTDPWERITSIDIVPEYSFENCRKNRKPYALYTVVFPAVKCSTIRIIGQPGGLFAHTKVAHLSAFYKDLTIWSPQVELKAPLPQIFQALSPKSLFELLYRLYPICDIFFTLVIGKINLIYFLDDVDYEKYKKLSETTALNSEYWRNIYNIEGAKKCNTLSNELEKEAIKYRKSIYCIREDGLIQMVCPVVYDGQLVGILKNYSIIRIDKKDPIATKKYLKRLGVNEGEYFSQLEKVPTISQEKLDSLNLFVESIANMISNAIVNSTMFLKDGKDTRVFQKIPNYEIVESSIQFMRENIDQELNGIDIATRYYISFGHFARIFKKAKGISPKHYLMGLRFEKAVLLLKTTDLPLIDVCLSCGFRSVSSFVRDFHLKYGISPERFRFAFKKTNLEICNANFPF